MTLILNMFSVGVSCACLNSPALFDTTVSPLVPFFNKAPIKFSGIPHNPKPPTKSLELSGIS